MKQRDVDRKAWANAAAMVRDADFGELFGDFFDLEAGATEEQMERAQRKVANACQKKADARSDV